MQGLGSRCEEEAGPFAPLFLRRGGWVPSEQICSQVQEVEEVREGHKAAASAQMAGIVEMAQSTEIGTPRKKEQRVDALASKKTYTCSQVRTRYHDDVTISHIYTPHDWKHWERSVICLH